MSIVMNEEECLEFLSGVHVGVIRIHPERWLSADFAKRVPQG